MPPLGRALLVVAAAGVAGSMALWWVPRELFAGAWIGTETGFGGPPVLMVTLTVSVVALLAAAAAPDRAAASMAMPVVVAVAVMSASLVVRAGVEDRIDGDLVLGTSVSVQGAGFPAMHGALLGPAIATGALLLAGAVLWRPGRLPLSAIALGTLLALIVHDDYGTFATRDDDGPIIATLATTDRLEEATPIGVPGLHGAATACLAALILCGLVTLARAGGVRERPLELVAASGCGAAAIAVIIVAATTGPGDHGLNEFPGALLALAPLALAATTMLARRSPEPT